jgi:hypothetical protein
MGFQTSTTNHTKVNKLERNVLLRRGMDLNSLTWLLVICVLFQMYTTLAVIQLACSFGNVITGTQTKYTYLSSTLYTSVIVGGEEVPCNLTHVFDTHGST